MLSKLGRIPAVGDEVTVDGWRLTVTRMDRNRIADLRLAAVPAEPEHTVGSHECQAEEVRGE